MPKVSVIVAVYKVENYIERCLHTLFSQTLDDIEYIFVDDASPDNSMNILERVLEKYPHRKSQVKIIRHSENRGVALARTNGILAATGEYMIHCDPDDYVDIDMYELMYDEAIKENSDIIFCDYIKHKKEVNSLISMNFKEVSIDYLRKPIYNGYISTLWNVLVKSEIIKKNNLLPFPKGDVGEDLALILRILYFSSTFKCLHKPFYHYCQREDSIANGSSEIEKLRKFHINIEGLINFYGNNKVYRKHCDYLKLNIKLETRKAFKENEKAWFNIYRDADRRILTIPREPLKTRILWSILLSNFMVYKFGCKIFKLIIGRPL
ncbi:MAG: glycosyltransferase [Muribaculaceae bacterium]|nr:glycosyltransferase [Muribaculaceae bacterium]